MTHPEEPPGDGGRPWLKIALVVLVGAVILALALSGALDPLRDRDRLEEFFTDSGPLGPIVYVLAFVLAQPLSLPGAVIIIPATFVWSGGVVFALSWLGGMVASTVGFVVARWLAQDWVTDRLPDRLRPWNDRLHDHGLPAVILLRLITGFAPAADWLLGVSAVTVPTFLVGTAIGLVPNTAILAFLGDDAVRLASRAPLVLAGAVLLGGLVVYAVRRRRRRVSPEAATDPAPDRPRTPA